MAFQWGFGNDILLPPIVATVFDAVDNGETWSSGGTAVVLAALAGFVFWGAAQLLDAVIVLGGLRLIPGLTDRLSVFLRKKGLVTPYADMKWSTRWAIAYATGASMLCLVDVFATGRQGLRHRAAMVLAAALLSAGSVGLVVGIVTAAAMVAKRVPATEGAAEVFIRFAKNPLTWVAIFAVVFVVGHFSADSDTDSESDFDNEANTQEITTSVPPAT